MRPILFPDYQSDKSLFIAQSQGHKRKCAHIATTTMVAATITHLLFQGTAGEARH